MSGNLLLRPPCAASEKHTHFELAFDDDASLDGGMPETAAGGIVVSLAYRETEDY